MKNNLITSYIVLLIFIELGCSKDSYQSSSVWNSCENKVAKDVNFRKGKWLRSNFTGRINPQGIDFKNDSIIDILEETNPDKWVFNIKYVFRPCNQLDYDQYWIPYSIRGPFQYWITYDTRYNVSTQELYFIYPSMGGGGVDTIKFKKR